MKTLIALIIVGFLPAVLAAPEQRDLQIFGWLERITLPDHGLTMTAKLDTGARTSSLSATDIEGFTRDGERWVRFRVNHPQLDDAPVIERPRTRTVRIVEHDGDHQRRAVVKVDLCIGGILEPIQVSLVDRHEFDYPMLIGRRALNDLGLVDARETFTSEPDCDASATEVD